MQILGAMDLPNGDVKNELFTLSVENYRDFSDFLNQKISIAVGAIASGRNVIFMSQKAQSLNWQKLCETPKNSELGLPTRCFFFLLILLTKVGMKLLKKTIKSPYFGRFGGR